MSLDKLDRRHHLNLTLFFSFSPFLSLTTEFTTITEDAYHGLVALVCPFILRTSMPHKHHVLCDVLAGCVEDEPPEDQTKRAARKEGRDGWPKEKKARGKGKGTTVHPGGHDDDSTAVNTDTQEEEDDEEESDEEEDGEDEDVEVGGSGKGLVVGNTRGGGEMTPPSLGDIGRAGAVRALKTLGATFTVRYNFTTQVFALDRNRREDWEESLAEEFGSAAERLFLTLFFTATEGRNLFILYLKNFDPIGLCAVGISYLISLSLAFLAILTFLLAAFFGALVVLLYIGLIRYGLWLPWRYIISPTSHFSGRQLRAVRRWWRGETEGTSNMDSTGTSRGRMPSQSSLTPSASSSQPPSCHGQHSPYLRTPPTTPLHTGKSGECSVGGGSVTGKGGRLPLHYRRERDRHSAPRYLMSLYNRYSPSYITARMISAFYSQWETLRTNKHRRTTEVISRHINLLGVCEAEPEGLLGPLVSFSVPSFVFGIEPIQAVVDYKFRTFGRAVLKTEAAIYTTLLLTFSAYLMAVHDPNSPIFYDVKIDWPHMHGKDSVRVYLLLLSLLDLFLEMYRITHAHTCSLPPSPPSNRLGRQWPRPPQHHPSRARLQAGAHALLPVYVVWRWLC